MTAIEEFSASFLEEHRGIRDLLFRLVTAFTEGDTGEARRLLEATAAATGPHFRYEEEALYPRLTAIFGDGYIDKLLADHDAAIRNARSLVSLSVRETLTDDERACAVGMVREILPHVSDCEGLSIMVETLPDEDVRRILEVRETARKEDLDLLEWASGVRGRSA